MLVKLFQRFSPYFMPSFPLSVRVLFCVKCFFCTTIILHDLQKKKYFLTQLMNPSRMKPKYLFQKSISTINTSLTLRILPRKSYKWAILRSTRLYFVFFLLEILLGSMHSTCINIYFLLLLLISFLPRTKL